MKENEADFSVFRTENPKTGHFQPIELDKDRIVVFSSSTKGLKEYAATLDRCGAQFTQTDRVAEAKKLIQTKEYSALMVDVTVADKNGMELMQWARREMPNEIKVYGFVRTNFPNLPVDRYILGADGMFLFERKEFVPLAGILYSALSNTTHLGWTRAIAYRQGEMSQKLIASGKPSTPLMLIGPDGVGKVALAIVAHGMSSRYEHSFIIADSKQKYHFHTIKKFQKDNKNVQKAIRNSLLSLLGLAYLGTIYFSSVHIMPLIQQEVLSEVLNDGLCRLPGEDTLKQFKGRIIFSTNSDLETMVDEGRFSQNLHRIISHNIMRVPSLNEHVDEIPEIAKAIVNDACLRLNAKPLHFSSKANEALREHNWRGNLSELYTVVQEALETTNGPTIKAQDLNFASSKSPYRVLDDKEKIEEEEIRKALKQTGGNKRKASKLLGMSPGKLYSRIEKYNITNEV